jgi:hypothetical protein
MNELPEVMAALDWLQRVHDSDPSARRLGILRRYIERAVAPARCVSGWCGPWRDGFCVDCGGAREGRLRDGIAVERRETIIEALAWWEDEDGRWGYEKARDVLVAHEVEWCGATAGATASAKMGPQ